MHYGNRCAYFCLFCRISPSAYGKGQSPEPHIQKSIPHASFWNITRHDSHIFKSIFTTGVFIERHFLKKERRATCSGSCILVYLKVYNPPSWSDLRQPRTNFLLAQSWNPTMIHIFVLRLVAQVQLEQYGVKHVSLNEPRDSGTPTLAPNQPDRSDHYHPQSTGPPSQLVNCILLSLPSFYFDIRLLIWTWK